MNVNNQKLLQNIYEISLRRSEMLKSRLRFLNGVEKEKKEVKRKMNLLGDLEQHIESGKKIKDKEEFRGFIVKAKKKSTLREKKMTAYQAVQNPEFFIKNGFRTSEYVKFARMRLRMIDKSFESCFSNIFKSDNQKRLDEKKKKSKLNIPCRIPKDATKDSMALSINCLKNIQKSRSVRAESYKNKRKRKSTIRQFILKQSARLSEKMKDKFRSSSMPIQNLKASLTEKKKEDVLGYKKRFERSKEKDWKVASQRKRYKKMRKKGLIVKSFRVRKDESQKRFRQSLYVPKKFIYVKSGKLERGLKRDYRSLSNYNSITSVNL